MLNWEFRFPPDKVKHLQDIEKMTGMRPKSLAERPIIRDELVFLWDAFNQLNRSRGLGFTAEPIRTPDIVAWLDLVGITDPEIRKQIYEIVTILDMRWMKLMDAKREADASLRKGGSGGD